MTLLISPAKSADETIPVVFNFLDQLEFGETITGAAMSAVVSSGTDASPSAILGGLPTVATPTVTQSITAGVVGVIYIVVCTVTGSNSHVYTQEVRIAVITPGGLFSNH